MRVIITFANVSARTVGCVEFQPESATDRPDYAECTVVRTQPRP